MNLEKYIKAHRDQFDDRNPDPALWDQIEARLPKASPQIRPASHESRRIVIWKWMSAAAIALVLILSGVIAGMFMGRGSMAKDPAYAELMEAEQYFNVEYNKKKSELSQYTYDPEVDRDLKELDKIYDDLSKELKVAGEPDKAELINAMIQIYKTRIELLERVLSKIEQNNNEKEIHQENENFNI